MRWGCVGFTVLIAYGSTSIGRYRKLGSVPLPGGVNSCIWKNANAEPDMPPARVSRMEGCQWSTVVFGRSFDKLERGLFRSRRQNLNGLNKLRANRSHANPQAARYRR